MMEAGTNNCSRARGYRSNAEQRIAGKLLRGQHTNPYRAAFLLHRLGDIPSSGS